MQDYQENQGPKVTKVMLDLQEQRENKDKLESLAHLDPKDKPVLLVQLEIRDQEPRESLENQDPKVTWETRDRKESLVLMESQEERETLGFQAHLESKVSLVLLELKVPQVHLERRGKREMKLHVNETCAWSQALPKAEWRCSTTASGGQSVTITLTLWMGRSSAECWAIRPHWLSPLPGQVPVGSGWMSYGAVGQRRTSSVVLTPE